MEFYESSGKPISITKWAVLFKTLYTETDRPRNPEEFWNAVMAHLSKMGEAIRRTHYPDLLKSAAHAFCWMCSYVSKCNSTDDLIFHFENSLPEIVGLKYPKKCGHCRDDQCKCDPDKMDEDSDKSAKYSELYDDWTSIRWEPYTISTWLKDFWAIYGSRLHLQHMESIGFHLLEEAGEEAKAVRQLIQFRGILDHTVQGIDKKFLIKISKIEGLVEEYKASVDFLKVHYSKANEKEAKQSIKLTDTNPNVIKARLVLAKMDFVIEIADTVAWFCAVLLKLSKTIKNFKNTEITSEQLLAFHVEEVLKKEYKYDDNTQKIACYACNKTKCECVFFPVLIKI